MHPTDDSGRAGATAPPGLDDLVERTERLQREAAALRERHRKMSKRLDAATSAAMSQERAAPAAPTPKPEPRRPARDQAETVRLVVTDLALTGADRETADTHLRETLGSEDHQEILDEVFGTQGGERRRRRFRRRS